MTEQIQAMENSTVNCPIDIDEIVHVITCLPCQKFINLSTPDRTELVEIFCRVISNVPKCDDDTCEEIIKKYVKHMEYKT